MSIIMSRFSFHTLVAALHIPREEQTEPTLETTDCGVKFKLLAWPNGRSIRMWLL